MSYTDKELLRASKSAYYIINSDVINEVKGYYDEYTNTTPTYTLSDLFKHSATFRKSIYNELRIAEGLTEEEKNALDNVADNEVVSYLDLSNKQTVLDSLNDNKIAYQRVEDIFGVIEEITSETGLLHDWKVTSFCYNNEMGEAGSAGILKNGVWEINDEYTPMGNGFVSVTFETDENNAIVAFRGSNGFDEKDQLLGDWVGSNLALVLEEEDTVQQRFADQYISDYILHLDYDNLAMTGHSLGGNLAMHATVSMYEQADTDTLPVIQTVGYDSPGFSDNYISRHSEAINSIPYMTHYKWSVVGAMLEQFENTNDWYTCVYSNYGIDMEQTEQAINRHDMAFVSFNDEYLESGYPNLLMNIAASLTWYINKYPEEQRPVVINYLIELIEATVDIVDLTATGEYTEEQIFAAFDFIIDHTLGTLEGDFAFENDVIIDLVAKLIFAAVSNIDDFISSSFVDTVYDLQKMCIDGTEHNIDDHFGVNVLLFPSGVTPEDVKVHLLSENDAVELRWGEEDNQYIVIQNFNNEDNNTRYNLLFHNNYENGTLVPANHPTSPFRTIYGSALGEPLAPIYDDQYPTTIYGEGGDDYIFGASADDIIDGGEDDDAMMGGAGNDTYIIYRNSGNDGIYDSRITTFFTKEQIYA